MSIKPSQLNEYPKRHPKAKNITLFARVKKWLLTAALLFVLLSVGMCELLRWMPPPTKMFMLYRQLRMRSMRAPSNLDG